MGGTYPAYLGEGLNTPRIQRISAPQRICDVLYCFKYTNYLYINKEGEIFPEVWRRMRLRARQVAYSCVSSGLVPSDSEFDSDDGGSGADDAWMSDGSGVSAAVGPGADVCEEAEGW